MPNKEATLRIPETLRKVKNIIGVFSAKGGVGKSEVSLNLALGLKESGYTVGLVDADIYGPSQPLLLNASEEEIEVKNKKLLTPLNKKGIKFISMGLIAKGAKPVIWRGPMVSGAVLQLLSSTDWQTLDYLIIDTPPGTGDVQLTLLQRIPLSAAIVVTTPQKVSVSDTRKGIEMIRRLDLPILGLVENMSFFQPEDSEKKYYLLFQCFLLLFCFFFFGSKKACKRPGRYLQSFLEAVRFIVTHYGPVASHGDPIHDQNCVYWNQDMCCVEAQDMCCLG